MKKVLRVLLSAVLAAAVMFTTVGATGTDELDRTQTVGGFLKSPSLLVDPAIKDYEIEVEGSEASDSDKLVLTLYRDRDELPELEKGLVNEGFDEISQNTKLTNLCPALEEAAKKVDASSDDLLVSDYFAVRISDSNENTLKGKFTVTMEADNLEYFVALLHKTEDGWGIVSDVKVDVEAGTITFSDEDFALFAIVVNSKKATSGTTGEGEGHCDCWDCRWFPWFFLTVAILSLLIYIIIVLSNKKKDKEEEDENGEKKPLNKKEEEEKEDEEKRQARIKTWKTVLLTLFSICVIFFVVWVLGGCKCWLWMITKK